MFHVIFCLVVSMQRVAPHAHVEAPSVRQAWLEFVYLCTEGSKISVELSVIEWAQFQLNRLWSRYDPSWKPKERREPLPRRVGIGCREIAVADPHDEISQCDLADGHDLIFAMIELVHGPFIGSKVFQASQQVALLLAVPLLLAEFLVALLIGPPHPRSYLLKLGIDHGFVFLDLAPQQMICHPLCH